MEKVKKQGMESFFCPYELALELKELGFDEISLFYYDAAYEGNPLSHCPHLLLNSQLEGFENEPISAPLWQQAFRFFREKKSLCSWVYQSNSGLYHYSILKDDRYLSSSYNNETTYKEAELACLKKLIEIIKKK